MILLSNTWQDKEHNRRMVARIDEYKGWFNVTLSYRYDDGTAWNSISRFASDGIQAIDQLESMLNVYS